MPILDTEMGEAMGLLLAFKWVRNLHLFDVDFEKDKWMNTIKNLPTMKCGHRLVYTFLL